MPEDILTLPSPGRLWPWLSTLALSLRRLSLVHSLAHQVSDDEMANLISQFDLNDNGASEDATPPNHLTTEPPVVLFLTYTCSLAVDFDEFCELMTRQAGGGPIEAVREAARQALAAPSAPTTHPANQARHPTN